MQASKVFDFSELCALFKEIGINLSKHQQNQFLLYYHEIRTWNRRINLISRNDENRIVTRHFLESSTLSLFEELNGNASVLDLGTGGGFPGVPLKIINQELKLMLLDSNRMKALFLKNLVKKLRLKNTCVLCNRAEEAVKMQENKNNYDVVVSRAVARLSILYGWARPFIRPGGSLIAIKGSRLEEELNDFRAKWPGIQFRTENVPIKSSNRSRRQRVVVIK